MVVPGILGLESGFAGSFMSCECLVGVTVSKLDSRSSCPYSNAGSWGHKAAFCCAPTLPGSLFNQEKKWLSVNYMQGWG